MNLKNFGVLEGRLTAEPFVAENKDGSKKVKFTVAVQNNYKNREGERDTQFVPVEAFIPAGRDFAKTPYNYVHKGSLVGVGYEVRSNVYEKAGEKVYGIVLNITDIELKESQAKVNARLAGQLTAESEDVPFEG